MKRALFTAAIALAAGAIGMTPASATATTPIYSSTPSSLTGNLPSYGPEAYAYKEFGDEVSFSGTARTLNTVTVTLSSWGCQSGAWNTDDCFTNAGATFAVPVRLNIYEASSTQSDGTVQPGDLIARVTKTFNVRYRPSANIKHCRGADLGKWYDTNTGGCYNGRLANITYNFSSLGIDLPDTAVFGISFNTTHQGPRPVGEGASCFSADGGCGYDSLNIALNPNTTVGAKPHPGTVFQNTSYAGNLCSGAVTDVFNLDSPNDPTCWAGYVPAIAVTAH